MGSASSRRTPSASRRDDRSVTGEVHKTSRRERSRNHLRSVRAAYLGAQAALSENFDEVAPFGGAPATGPEAEALAEARLRQELAEMSTGHDAVAFFTRHSFNTRVKLLYCNRRQKVPGEEEPGPYDLVVVPKEQLHAEHFIISASGVVCIRPDQLSECTPLAEWVHISMVHRVLTAMSFFRLFPQRKAMAQWRQSARHAMFCRRRQRLARRCLFTKPLFVEPLVEAKAVIGHMGCVPMLRIPEQCCMVEDFVEKQVVVMLDPLVGAQRELEQQRELLVGVLQSLQLRVRGASEAIHAPLPAATRSKSVVQEKQEIRERARRQQQIREDEALVTDCIYLVDLMLQASLAELLRGVALTMLTRLDGSPAEPRRRLFSVSATFKKTGPNEESRVFIEPSEETFTKVLTKIWEDSFRVTDSVVPVSSAKDVARAAGEVRPFQLALRELLAGDRSWTERTSRSLESLKSQLAEAHQWAVEMYGHYKRIFDFGLTWDQATFNAASHSSKSLVDMMLLMLDFQADLAKLRPTRTVGILQLEGRALRDTLAPVPEAALAALKPKLLGNVREQCHIVLRRCEHYVKVLDERPTRGASFTNFSHTFEAADAEATALQDQVDEVQSLYRLLQRQGVRIPLDDQVTFEILLAKGRELVDETMPAATAFLAQQRLRPSSSIRPSSSLRPSPSLVVTVDIPIVETTTMLQEA